MTLVNEGTILLSARPVAADFCQRLDPRGSMMRTCCRHSVWGIPAGVDGVPYRDKLPWGGESILSAERMRPNFLDTRRFCRYQTAEEPADKNRLFMAGWPATACEPPMTRRLSHWISQHPSLTRIFLLPASLLLINGGTVFVTVREADQRSAAADHCLDPRMIHSTDNGHRVKLLFDSRSQSDPCEPIEFPDVLFDDLRNCEESESAASSDLQHRTVGEFAGYDRNHIQIVEPAI